MGKLRSVPRWVCPSLRAVSGTESFVLWLYDRTCSPEALGVWSALFWLGGADGEQTPGPLVRAGMPSEVMAVAEMRVANAIADGGAYPAPSWWARNGIDASERMTPEQWAERVHSGYERHYAHGVTVALGWVLGEVHDPALMAPIRNGDGELIPEADREEYRTVLQKLSTS